jgi:hypothetical protein
MGASNIKSTKKCIATNTGIINTTIDSEYIRESTFDSI